MEDFTYSCKTKIIFGKCTESEVGKEIKSYASKVLFHFGRDSIKKSGLYIKVKKSLNDSKIEFIELGGVVPNPRVSLVRDGIKLCKDNNVDFILAVGGGSVIDSAKAIAAGVFYSGDIWEMFINCLEVKDALPVGTILTIPAAGSESSPNSVISNETEKRKLHIAGDNLRPVFSILNPELTCTLPDFQTACGIADMFVHIAERYFTKTKNVDLTDKLCEGAMKSVIGIGKKVMENPDDYDFRAEIMWASTIAHNGILGTGRIEDWASHGIEHELSAYYDIAHGAGLAAIVPAWMKYVYSEDVKLFSQFARNVMGIENNDDNKAALEGIEKLKSFFKEIGLPASIKELGIDDSKFAEMSKKAVELGPRGNFKKLNSDDIERIFSIANE